MISFAGGKCTADQNYVLVLAAIVRVIRNKTKLGRNMFAAGASPYIQYIIRGLIIILAVSIDVRKYIVKK